MVRTGSVAKKVSKAAKNIKEENSVQVQEPVQEKRVKPKKKRASSDVLDRIKRAITQRLYLVNQEDVSCIETGFGRKYAVLGSTGNVYDVKIAQIPTCSCPDCAKGRLCKHIIFVMVKVLHVPQDSELVYQQALLQSELGFIFDSAPKTATGVVQAKKEVVAAYKKTFCLDEKEEEEEEPVAEAEVNVKEAEGDCPVCFEDLAGGEALDSCSTCRNFIHKDCLKMWLAVQLTCCYCRTDWHAHGSGNNGDNLKTKTAAGQVKEGYVNLGEIQGLSGHRDTSSYNDYRGRWGGGYGRYGGYRKKKNWY
jgi:hypothetical protein